MRLILQLVAIVAFATTFVMGVALAQDVIAVTPKSGFDLSGFTGSLLQIVATAVLGAFAVLAAFLQKKLDKIFDGKVQINDLISDEMKEKTARMVVRLGYAHALRMMNATEEDLKNVDTGNKALNYAVGFLTTQYPEIQEWIEGRVRSSVIDWVAAARKDELLKLKAA